MKEILILNGAARKTGNTKKLIDAFTRGAERAGNNVTEFFFAGHGNSRLQRLRRLFAQ